MGYFDEQIAAGQPIFPPTEQQAPSINQPAQQDQVENKPTETAFIGTPVRIINGGDNVYLIKEGKKYWVTTLEKYNALGFKLGDEVKMDKTSMDLFTEGEPIR